jgi:hypothetical protein
MVRRGWPGAVVYGSRAASCATCTWAIRPDPAGATRTGGVRYAAHHITVAWSSLGDYSDAVLAFASADAVDPLLAREYALGLSRGYIEDVGTAGATLDMTGVPGIPDDWQIDPARWFARALIVNRDVPGEPLTVRSVSELNPARPARADASFRCDRHHASARDASARASTRERSAVPRAPRRPPTAARAGSPDPTASSRGKHKARIPSGYKIGEIFRGACRSERCSFVALIEQQTGDRR